MRNVRKLVLSKETLRELTGSDLRRVVGALRQVCDIDTQCKGGGGGGGGATDTCGTGGGTGGGGGQTYTCICTEVGTTCPEASCAPDCDLSWNC